MLKINKIRAIENDILAGNNPLAVRLGPLKSRYYHATVITVAFLCLVLFTLLYLHGWYSWLFLLSAPVLFMHIRRVLGDMTATGMRPLLEQMVKAALLVNILFSAGLICQRL